MEDVEKKIVTIMSSLIWLCLGLFQSIGGPTMIDLMARFNASYDDIGWAMSSNGVGIIVSALIGGALVDMKTSWQDTMIAIPQLCASMALMSVPVMANVNTLWFMFFTLGATVGLAKISSQRMLVKMWKADVAVPFHLIHLTYGIGSIMAPALADNVFAELILNDNTDNTKTTNSTIKQYVRKTDLMDYRVDIAYVTSGIMTALMSLPFFIYSICRCCNKLRQGGYTEISEDSQEKPESVCQIIRQKLDPATFAGGSRGFGIFTLTCLAVHYINSVGGQQAIGNFVRAFSEDSLDFSRDESMYLNTAFWVSFTVGRIATTVWAHFINTRALLLMYTIWHAAAATCLLLLVGKSHVLLWVLITLVGLSIGPMNPAFMSYVNTKIEINGVILTVVTCFQGIGSLTYLWMEGLLYHSRGPRVVLYVEEVYALVVLAVAGVFIVVSMGYRDIYDDRKRTDTEEHSEVNDTD